MKVALAPHLLAAAALLSVSAYSQTETASKIEPAPKADLTPVRKANYELAERWTAPKVGKLVFGMAVTPHWLQSGGDRFWYSYETSSGRSFYLVDPAKKSQAPLFDNAKVASMLTEITRTPYNPDHLPIRTIKFIKNDTAVEFELRVSKDSELNGKQVVNGVDETVQTDEQEKTPQQRGARSGPAPAAQQSRTLYLEYDLASKKLLLPDQYTPEPKKPMWASISPDRKTIIFSRKNDLFMMDAASYALALKKADDPNIKEVQLTTDGVENYSYARRISGTEMQQLQDEQREQGGAATGFSTKPDKAGRVAPVVIHWSKDSKKIALLRRDERKVGDLWVIHTLENPRPTLESYKYSMPGEVNVPQHHLEVFDLEARAHKAINVDRFQDQTLQIFDAPVKASQREKDRRPDLQWVADTSDKLYIKRMSRDQHKVDICFVDVNSGTVKTLIEERLNTYVETKPLRLIKNGEEILFWSERDGWGHYYLYDANGRLENQVTSGQFVTEDILDIDEKTRTMTFEGEGREKGENPYFPHLYSIKLDGTSIKMLDPGNASHAFQMADDGRYFVDNASMVNTAPASVLYDRAGVKTLDLQTTDISALMDAGFRMPEPFQVKADDGITDLYGVMYKPFDFDASKKYPIVAYVYPGPQTEQVTQTFSPKNANVALAQLGFIVVEVGNRGGNPHRSKWYHNYGYGNLRDYGLADKKAAIEQLAARHPWIDLDRVGITGHSGGGFMSTAAMLQYPDFFKVAVSESGNHENNVYNQNWSEKHNGIKEVDGTDGKVSFDYSIEKNSELAKNLKGHLLLTTGDMDDNVHMANTMRMADALIKAHKRFDQFVLPGMRHSYRPEENYFFWVRADYFCRWLLGDFDQRVDLVELDPHAPMGAAPSTDGATGADADDQQN